MKIFFIFLITLVSCTSTPHKNSPELSSLKLALKLKSKVAEKIWPGYSKLNSIVYLNTVEGQFHIQEYNFTKFRIKDFKTTRVHPYDKEYSEKRVYHSAYLSKLMPKIKESFFMIDSEKLMANKGRNWNPYDWTTIYLHETFHIFQNNQFGKELTKDPMNFNSTPLKALKKNKDYIKAINKEQLLVRKALLKLDFKSAKARKNFCNEFLSLRESRFKKFKLSKATKKSELFYETIEGSARYFEKMVDLIAMEMPELKAYMNKDLLGYYAQYGKKTFIYMISELEPNSNYYYETGFTLGLLLDKLKPDWQHSAFQTSMWEQVKSACK